MVKSERREMKILDSEEEDKYQSKRKRKGNDTFFFLCSTSS